MPKGAGMMAGLIFAIVATGAATISRASAPGPSAEVVVVGNGSVLVPPDIAKINYSVRGEGVSARSAIDNLATKRAAIELDVAASGLSQIKWSSGELKVNEDRGKNCVAVMMQPHYRPLSAGLKEI